MAQTVAAFALRAWHVTTLPMVIYAAALWGLGLSGGYALAFLAPADWPAAVRGANGFWVAATGGLTLAALALAALLRRVGQHTGNNAPA